MPESKLEATLSPRQDIELRVEDEAAGLVLEHRIDRPETQHIDSNPRDAAGVNDLSVIDDSFAVDWAVEEA